MFEIANEVIVMIIGVSSIGGTVFTIIRVKSNQIKNSIKLETMSSNKIKELCDDVTILKQDSVSYGILHGTMNKTISEKADKTALADLKYKVANLEGKFDQHNVEMDKK